jgi:hypothetical protein
MIMKKLAMFLALVLATMMLFTAAVAETVQTPSITAHKFESAPTIDGDLSDWDLSSVAELSDAAQVIRDAVFWQGANDLSAKAYVAYDAENLYFAFEVTEDTPFGAIEMLPLDGEDNVKLYISTDPTDDPARSEFHANDFLLYLITDGEYYDTAFDRSMVPKDYRMRFISRGMDGGEDVLTDYQAKAVASANGYIWECAIPLSNFSNEKIAQYIPQSGDTVKFDIAFTDISYPCPGTEYIPQIAWCGDLDINNNPSMWGNLIFE